MEGSEPYREHVAVNKLLDRCPAATAARFPGPQVRQIAQVDAEVARRLEHHRQIVSLGDGAVTQRCVSAMFSTFLFSRSGIASERLLP
jgi:hypothetical protein